MNRTKPSDLSGTPDLLERWNQWQGAIECGLTGQRWEAKELRSLADAFADALTAQGAVPGSGVALSLTNSAMFPVALSALLQLECNPYLVFAGTREEELKRTLREFGIRLAVHDFVEGVSAISSDTFPTRATWTMGGRELSVLETDRFGGASDFAVPARGVIMHPTSGTYGRARYCARNQRAAIAEAENYAETIDFYRNTRVRVTTPLSHAYAYGFGLITSIITDSTLIVDTTFNPKKVLREEQLNASGIMTVVPPMVSALTAAGRRGGSGMAKAVFYAGAPCPVPAIQEFESCFDSPLYCIYGTTETGGISSSYGPSGRSTGVGMPLAHVDVDVRNTDDFEELGESVGEIFVRSTSMMQGYLTPEMGARALDWWSTADLGNFTDSGLHIVGRTKDIINLGGMKVDPAEVEAILRTHPDVLDVAVYPGMKSDESEFVQAAVSLRPGVEATDEIRSFCLSQLDRHKVPTRIHMVESVPRSPSGKCLKIQCPEFPATLIMQ